MTIRVVSTHCPIFNFMAFSFPNAPVTQFHSARGMPRLFRQIFGRRAKFPNKFRGQREQLSLPGPWFLTTGGKDVSGVYGSATLFAAAVFPLYCEPSTQPKWTLR